MNDSEKRREAMLAETRRRYRSGQTPAVHPRYRAAYRAMYEGNDETNSGSSLGIRILISLILFAVFAAADYQGEKIGIYSPGQIASEIERQPDLSGYLDGI